MGRPSPIARILRHPVASTESRESSALLTGAGAFALGTLVGLIVFWGHAVPISGRGSIGNVIAIGGALAAIGAFLLGCALRRAQPRSDPSGDAGLPRPHWFDVAALTLAHAAIALLGWIGVELVAAVLIFSWIIVFLRNTEAVVTSRPESAPSSNP